MLKPPVLESVPRENPPRPVRVLPGQKSLDIDAPFVLTAPRHQRRAHRGSVSAADLQPPLLRGVMPAHMDASQPPLGPRVRAMPSVAGLLPAPGETTPTRAELLRTVQSRRLPTYLEVQRAAAPTTAQPAPAPTAPQNPFFEVNWKGLDLDGGVEPYSEREVVTLSPGDPTGKQTGWVAELTPATHGDLGKDDLEWSFFRPYTTGRKGLKYYKIDDLGDGVFVADTTEHLRGSSPKRSRVYFIIHNGRVRNWSENLDEARKWLGMPTVAQRDAVRDAILQERMRAVGDLVATPPLEGASERQIKYGDDLRKKVIAQLPALKVDLKRAAIENLPSSSDAGTILLAGERVPISQDIFWERVWPGMLNGFAIGARLLGEIRKAKSWIEPHSVDWKAFVDKAFPEPRTLDDQIALRFARYLFKILFGSGAPTPRGLRDEVVGRLPDDPRAARALYERFLERVRTDPAARELNYAMQGSIRPRPDKIEAFYASL